jgi:hypothetical protein
VPSQGPPTRQPAGKAFLAGFGGLVFLLGVGLFLGNTTGLFPTLPFEGFIVMTVGGLLMGAGATARSPDSLLDRAFHVKVQMKLSDYREWSTARTFSGCRFLRYSRLNLVEARDIPVAEVERQVEGLMYRGFQVDWTEHQGRLFLRVWAFGDPGPDWANVLPPPAPGPPTMHGGDCPLPGAEDSSCRPG